MNFSTFEEVWLHDEKERTANEENKSLSECISLINHITVITNQARLCAHDIKALCVRVFVLRDKNKALTTRLTVIADRNIAITSLTSLSTHEKRGLTSRISVISNKNNSLTDRVSRLVEDGKALSGRISVLTGNDKFVCSRIAELVSDSNNLSHRVSVLADKCNIPANNGSRLVVDKKPHKISDEIKALRSSIAALEYEGDLLTHRIHALTDKKKAITLVVDINNAVKERVSKLSDISQVLSKCVCLLVDDNKVLDDRIDVLLCGKNALTTRVSILVNEKKAHIEHCPPLVGCGRSGRNGSGTAVYEGRGAGFNCASSFQLDAFIKQSTGVGGGWSVVSKESLVADVFCFTVQLEHAVLEHFLHCGVLARAGPPPRHPTTPGREGEGVLGGGGLGLEETNACSLGGFPDWKKGDQGVLRLDRLGKTLSLYMSRSLQVYRMSVELEEAYEHIGVEVVRMFRGRSLGVAGLSGGRCAGVGEGEWHILFVLDNLML